MTLLILVAGHAIPRRMDSLDVDQGWFLKHFQAGEARWFVEHVGHGVLLATGDPDAPLILPAVKPIRKPALAAKARAIAAAAV